MSWPTLNKELQHITRNTKLPLVAIVGRPNVGKSTLFNRLLEERKAITDSVPGVTRDLLEARCMIGDSPVTLVDTGGVKSKPTVLEEKVSEKSLHVVSESDVVLLVMDVTGITPDDQEFIEKLRKYSDKVILVINKVDNPDRDTLVWNFYALGFENMIGISAAHGRNIQELKVMILGSIGPMKAPVPEDQVPDDREPDSRELDLISIAILGKPNTGKSTLVNTLTEREIALVAESPGTTRDPLEGYFRFGNQLFKVIDTAGIRRKKKITDDIEYYSVNRAIKSIDRADIVFLIIDIEEGLSEQDKKIAALVVERGKGIVLVLNKWDRLPQKKKQFKMIKERISFLFPIMDFAPLVPLSALKKTGIDELLRQGIRIWKQLNTRVETGRLNRHLKNWVESTPPPTVKGKRHKLRYLTQISAPPVHFILFVNRSRGFPSSYLQYIRNKIRYELGFSSVPIRIDIRERK